MESNDEQLKKMEEEKKKKKEFIAKMISSSNPNRQKVGKAEQEAYERKYGKE